MTDEDAFLQAIADRPNDEGARRGYAEWLEARGDSRGEFLRLQAALRSQVGSLANAELCEREQALLKELDPKWVEVVRQYSTVPPCRDLAQLVPELSSLSRITTRLHPHRALAPLPLGISKIGGRFLWPVEEAWPVCPVCDVDLVPVLQLRRQDASNIEFPDDTDLLQMFWCAVESTHEYQPEPRIWWRDSSTIQATREDSPDLSEFPRTSDDEGYIPFECRVYPEEVVEYPVGDDRELLLDPAAADQLKRHLETFSLGAADDLQERFTSEYGPSDAWSLAFYELGQCPGSKVGGRPGLVRDGVQFDHLVTLATWEFDSASFRRWLSVEDQRQFAPPGKPLTWKRLFKDCRSKPAGRSSVSALHGVLGMQLGRTQRIHVFVNRNQQPWDVWAYVND